MPVGGGLTELIISNCPLAAAREALTTLTSLKELAIRRCAEAEGALAAASSLRTGCVVHGLQQRSPCVCCTIQLGTVQYAANNTFKPQVYK